MSLPTLLRVYALAAFAITTVLVHATLHAQALLPKYGSFNVTLPLMYTLSQDPMTVAACHSKASTLSAPVGCRLKRRKQGGQGPVVLLYTRGLYWQIAKKRMTHLVSAPFGFRLERWQQGREGSVAPMRLLGLGLLHRNCHRRWRWHSLPFIFRTIQIC